jgi:hypothetical protein
MGDVSVMPGVMCTSRAGARTFVASSPISLASSVAPLGSRKTLFDRRPVFANGSVGVPTLDVAPLSTTADGIDPLSTPRRTSSLWRYVRCTLSSLIAASDLVAHWYVVSSSTLRAVRFCCASCLPFSHRFHRSAILLEFWWSVGRRNVMRPFPRSVVRLLSRGCLRFDLARWRGENGVISRC